ncbi:uncharacterized protein VTP21DRAFT_1166 [Calcarisporiella thermophila]|uniref:uncharacterized protein n=1 Tax=Calcarisporiella thermophila TaxID=911321 RepID=UPI0037437B65
MSKANTNPQQPPKIRRIAVLGQRAVGKSTLTVQFVENHFVPSYHPTIESTFNKTIKYKGREYSIEIIDTAGQDEYSILSDRHAIGIHGYVLVYSITSKQSLDTVKIIREKILNHTGTEWVPIVLVGNKSDLHMQRQITVEEGKELATQWNCQAIEASAKHNENIAKIFDLMISEIEKSHAPAQENQSSCVVQ